MIKRGKHSRNFTVLPNSMIEDAALSIETRGMLAYLVSRPEDWEIRHQALQRAVGVTAARLRRMIQEALAAGYMRRDDGQPRDQANRFTTYDYVVEDVPIRSAVSVNGKPSTESRQRKSCDGSKKEKQKTEDTRTEGQTPTSPPPRRAASPQVAIREQQGGGYPFSDFENAYPFEPWMSPSAADRLWRKLSDIEQVEAAAAAELYAADCKAKGRKVQNAKSWLGARFVSRLAAPRRGGMHGTRDYGHHRPQDAERGHPLHGCRRSDRPGRPCDGEANRNIQWQTSEIGLPIQEPRH
jgi:hypothetical protein